MGDLLFLTYSTESSFIGLLYTRGVFKILEIIRFANSTFFDSSPLLESSLSEVFEMWLFRSFAVWFLIKTLRTIFVFDPDVFKLLPVVGMLLFNGVTVALVYCASFGTATVG